MYYRKEFAEHARIDEALGSTTYFADPFSSWQMGSNENFNGLLRPKTCNSSNYNSDQTI